MRPIRLSVTLQELPSGWAARVLREDGSEQYGFQQTLREPMDAIGFAAGTVMRELAQAIADNTGEAA